MNRVFETAECEVARYSIFCELRNVGRVLACLVTMLRIRMTGDRGEPANPHLP